MFLSSDSLTHEQSGKLRLGYRVVNALGIYPRLVQINPILQYSSMDTYFATVCMRKLLRNARRHIKVVVYHTNAHLSTMQPHKEQCMMLLGKGLPGHNDETLMS